MIRLKIFRLEKNGFKTWKYCAVEASLDDGFTGGFVCELGGLGLYSLELMSGFPWVQPFFGAANRT